MKKIIGELLLTALIVACLYVGVGVLVYIDERNITRKCRALYNFKNDPRNYGQYIMDFDTGIWYDIDGLNPNVPPLTINEMDIKNIRDRIITSH